MLCLLCGDTPVNPQVSYECRDCRADTPMERDADGSRGTAYPLLSDDGRTRMDRAAYGSVNKPAGRKLGNRGRPAAYDREEIWRRIDMGQRNGEIAMALGCTAGLVSWWRARR